MGVCGILCQGWSPSLSHEPVCPHTHTWRLHAHSAPTHAQPALTLWTGPSEPSGSQRSQAERSLVQLEPEDVNRDRATASGQAQQRQTGLQEERYGTRSHLLYTLKLCLRKEFLITLLSCLIFYIMKREIHLIRLLYLTFRLGVLI